MTARLTFLVLAVFWLTMNVLLWRAEYGSNGADTPVPLALVCQKILTAPDASSLTVYQGHERVGYCEISSGVGREMAEVDSDRPPPENLVKHAGYQVHLAGNVSFGGNTNRFKFDGRIQFSDARQWREMNLKIITRQAVVEIGSLATNRSVHFKLSSEGAVLERDLSVADLQNPAAIIRAFAGNAADPLIGTLDLPDISASEVAQSLEWKASRTRVRIGTEHVPVYRLETRVLGRNVTVDVSTLGEILSVELPGNINARIDEWRRL
jgi:hypothetical protein